MNVSSTSRPASQILTPLPRERPKSAFETLERMVNKTTLTIQRVTHDNILDFGDHLVGKSATEENVDKEKALQEAVDQAEARFTRELRICLKRQKKKLEDERIEAVQEQKKYYERHMAKVSAVRDMAEAENVKELRRQFDVEKEEALMEQAARLEEEKQRALQLVRAEERKKLDSDFKKDIKIAVDAALVKAEKDFLKREQASIERTRAECERILEARLAEAEAKHQGQVAVLVNKYKHLHGQLQKAIQHYIIVERDFLALQDDYRRFLDYTDGMFHSDYMLSLRSHALELAKKTIEVVKYDAFDSIEQFANVA